ncbi:MAG: helix-turn-helix transcriptional regulator [Pyrinomonadaceae bacterium]
MSTAIRSPSGPDNFYVSDRSLAYDRRGLTVSLTHQSAHVFPVGMMILNVDGEVLSCNASARDIILTDGNVDQHLADIRRQVLSSETTRWSGDGAGSSSSRKPIAQLLVSQGTRWYGLRGFWLEARSDSGSSLIGVVIEQINLRRLDMQKAQRLYHLSPREISVITALAAGKTDKEIAMTLDVRPETVRWYLKNIRNKMSVSTRTGILHKVFYI